MTEHNNHFDSFLKFFCGGLAGIIAKTAIAPIDRVKFLFMASIKEFTFSNLLKEIHRIRAEEGLRALWKGNLAQILRVFPYSGIQFSVYGHSEKYLSSIFPQEAIFSSLSKYISGSIAGTSALLISYPFDVLRTRLAYQTTTKIYTGIFQGFYNISKQEGFQSFFRGVTPALIGASMYGGTTFTIFFSLKNSNPDAGKLEIFCFGSFAGLIGQILTYPLDVVRKRMLAHGFIEKVSALTTSRNGEQRNTMREYFSEIWRNEGYRGMMKGISLNFLKAPIMLGTVHLANDSIHKYLNEDY